MTQKGGDLSFIEVEIEVVDGQLGTLLVNFDQVVHSHPQGEAGGVVLQTDCNSMNRGDGGSGGTILTLADQGAPRAAGKAPLQTENEEGTVTQQGTESRPTWCGWHVP